MTPQNPIETFEVNQYVYENLFGSALRHTRPIQPMRFDSDIRGVSYHLNYRPKGLDPKSPLNFGFLNLGIGIESPRDPKIEETLYLVRFEITPPESWPTYNSGSNTLYAMPILARNWRYGGKEIFTFGMTSDNDIFESMYHTAIVQTVADSFGLPVFYGVQQEREGQFGLGFIKPSTMQQYSHYRVFPPNS